MGAWSDSLNKRIGNFAILRGVGLVDEEKKLNAFVGRRTCVRRPESRVKIACLYKCTYNVLALSRFYPILNKERAKCFMEKSGRVNLRVDPEVKKRCEEIAKASGVSLSSLIQTYLASLASRGKVPLISLARAEHLEQGPSVLSFDAIYQTVNEVLSAFPKEKVKKAYLFGSYAREEAKEKSDVDILLEAGEQLSLFDLGRINGELSERFHKSVDVVSSLKSLDPRMVERVKKERQIIYESRER